MDKMVRISISIDNKTLRELDQLKEITGLKDRSTTIRHAIKELLKKYNVKVEE